MTIEKLLVLTEEELRQHIILVLKSKKIPYKVTDDYIFTQHKGIMPLVCVHTDIVGNIPPTKDQIVKSRGVLSVREDAKVLGADDRAGVYIALGLLHRKDLNFAFFAQEETGGKGSTQFAMREDLEQYNAFIGLDRASRGGKQNVATYGYNNEGLIALFDFPESRGSMCDSSVLSGYCNIACVNLSVGYENEHSNKETLDLGLLQETLQVMKDLVVPYEVYTYEVQEMDWGFPDDFKSTWRSRGKYEAIVCDNCGTADILYMVDGMHICELCIPEVEETYFIS